MTNYFYNILIELKKQKKIVSIFSDAFDQSEFSVGFIDTVVEDELRLKSISKDGKYDGYEIFPFEEIKRINYSGKYEKKIEFLLGNRDKLNDDKLSYPIEDHDIILTSLKEAKDKKLPVIIWNDDKDENIQGYILELDENFVKIQSIDDYGDENGCAIIHIYKIGYTEINSIRAQRIDLLVKSG